MALRGYGALVGRVVDRRAEPGQETPHYQLHVAADSVDYRVAVNVMSNSTPADLLFAADEHFEHPMLADLVGLGEGFHPLTSTPGGAALDYVRANAVTRADMHVVPSDLPGPDNDLADKLEHYVTRAMADPQARVFALGQRWGPEDAKPDKVFGFSPGNGVHDIHMNQGNDLGHARDDGIWQDGALLLHFPRQASPDQWVAIFLAFQSQSWHTDEHTGHALRSDTAPGGGAGAGGSGTGATGGPAQAAERRVRIVAAMVNPDSGDPEPETVTLLNAAPEAIDLAGWSLLDREQAALSLAPTTVPPVRPCRSRSAHRFTWVTTAEPSPSSTPPGSRSTASPTPATTPPAKAGPSPSDPGSDPRRRAPEDNPRWLRRSEAMATARQVRREGMCRSRSRRASPTPPCRSPSSASLPATRQ